jgi:endonuclease G
MKTFTAFLFACIATVLIGQTESINKLSLELPNRSFDTIIQHTGYSVSYNQKYKQANWAAYQLTNAETSKLYDRENKFVADPLIPGTDLCLDYEKSGYDRRHLAPAADMGFSKITMTESFYYSNMSPQLPGFNRGIWKQLEEQTRNWAIEYDSLYIVVGPIFSDSMKLIGPHQVAVPNSYYKVILDNHKGKEKMIGFVMKNEGSKNSLQSFVLSVDSIEVLSGIDFFPLLEDSLENKLESLVFLNSWKWSFVKNVKKKK